MVNLKLCVYYLMMIPYIYLTNNNFLKTEFVYQYLTILSHFLRQNTLNIRDANYTLVHGWHAADATHGHQVSLLTSLQVHPDNDPVLLVVPEPALALPGGADHLLADLGVLRDGRQQVVKLLTMLLQRVTCLNPSPANLHE